MSQVLFQILALLFIFVETTSAHPNKPRLSILNGKSVTNPLTTDFEFHNYTQTLDHFNYKPESYTTFQQRYLVISKYWGGVNTSSPIFVYMGAEIDVITEALVSGFFQVLGSQFNGLLVYIEHRYYGTSMPFGSKDKAYKDANSLGFFTSEQALADYAQLMVDYKRNLSAENCPIIVVGGSYGGMLASWFRLKYPHIAYGALAVSAPILYFEGLTPENGYAVVVSKDFNSTSKSCYKSIRESWFEIDKVAAQHNGLLNLSQIFNTCLPLNTSQELKDSLEGRYDLMAQYDNMMDNFLHKFCTACDAAGNETYILDKITAGFNAAFGKRCIGVSDDGLDKDFGWDWQVDTSTTTTKEAQSCTEMVMPMGNGENDTMFQAKPFDMANFTKECKEVFGVTPRPYWAPIEFGGHDIKNVLGKFASNIIFSNGLRDPYSSGGVLQNISDTVIAVYSEQGHHCSDLQTPTNSDPEWLTAQRMTEIKVIEGWLAAYPHP
ncbi:hypothetical protein OSB04_009326 [Centaurea solstitialis]|uniref:Lysosomal Pro-X carboxypeptidase n=1 Tax=Centaurea solstitialis TaxID=347529 RepID=A0AA38TNH5_9ASTR|nr:hypothetical protein OSB04_009326 [Centaurea solstitialis]